MADGIDFALNEPSFNGLLQSLNKLEYGVRKRVAGSAALAAMTPVLKAAKANVAKHNRTGLLQFSLIKKRKAYDEGATVWVGVGAKKGMGINDPKFGKVVASNYAHLVEYGNDKWPGDPFLRPAIDTNKNKVIAIAAKNLRKGIDRETRKAASKK